MYSREAVLAGSLVVLVLMFIVTAFVARLYHKRIHQLGDGWFAKGESDFRSGAARAAIADYRNGLVYSPNDRTFQFHLAQALAASGRTDEAQSYLLSLLSASPGSGEVNLALARVAVRRNAALDALRYYHGAIYGVWEQDPIPQRWRVRRELCEHLLNSGAKAQADAEIIALAENTPGNEAAHLDIAGGLLLRVQLWTRALAEFRSALLWNRHDGDALAGAGTAAFQLGEYSGATAYFDRLPAPQCSSVGVSEMLQLSRDVQSLSPFVPGIPAAEEVRRTSAALAASGTRLGSCARQKAGAPGEQTLLTQIHQAQREFDRLPRAQQVARRDSDMSLVFQAEDAAARQCGPPPGPDRALLLIARSRRGAAQ